MKISKRKATGTLAKMIANIDEDSLRRTRDKMALASRISDAISAKGWTQKSFAKKLNKSEAEISECLSGERNFTVEKLSDIENVLGISLLVKESPSFVTIEKKPFFSKEKSSKKLASFNNLEVDLHIGCGLCTYKPSLIYG